MSKIFCLFIMVLLSVSCTETKKPHEIEPSKLENVPLNTLASSDNQCADVNYDSSGRVVPYGNHFEVLSFPYEEMEKGRDHVNVAFVMINTLGSENALKEYLGPSTIYSHSYYTPLMLAQMYVYSQNSSANFLKEVSGSHLTMSGMIAGWYDYCEGGDESSCEAVDHIDIIRNKDKFLALAKNDINFDDYDVFYLVTASKGRGGATGWKRSNSFTVDGKTYRNVGFDFLTNSYIYPCPHDLIATSNILPNRSWAHEFIHTMGISGHNLALACSEGVLEGDCELKPYGGAFSVMGSSAFSNHLDLSMKKKMGWVTYDQFISVTSSGSFVIHPNESKSTSIKGLEIPLPEPLTVAGVSFDRLFVEYRSNIGFDNVIEKLDGGWFLSNYTSIPSVDYKNGVLVYLDYDESINTDATVLLDMHPLTSFNSRRGIYTLGTPGRMADSFLMKGETFKLSDIEIKVLGPKDGGMEVEVKMPCDCTCS